MAEFPAQAETVVLSKNSVTAIDNDQTFQAALENFEKKLITHALEQNRWHREKTAASLGLPHRTFFRKMKRYGLIRQK